MEQLMERYNAQVGQFESRVNMLAEEYDNLLEHVPSDLSECCSIISQPEPESIHVSLEISGDCDLPPIVTQRIKETFMEFFPDGVFN